MCFLCLCDGLLFCDKACHGAASPFCDTAHAESPLFKFDMNVILLLILLMGICNGCKKELKNEHGLKRHRASCHASKAHTAILLQQRQLLQRSIKRGHEIGKHDGSVLLEALIDDVSRPQIYTVLKILKILGN